MSLWAPEQHNACDGPWCHLSNQVGACEPWQFCFRDPRAWENFCYPEPVYATLFATGCLCWGLGISLLQSTDNWWLQKETWALCAPYTGSALACTQRQCFPIGWTEVVLYKTLAGFPIYSQVPLGVRASINLLYNVSCPRVPCGALNLRYL